MSPQRRRHRSRSAEETLRVLPTDLILEIFTRLPSKSIARCRCLSKLWASLLSLDSPYFTELFLTQSKTRPRLLLAVQRNNEWCLYSCPQPQISYKNPKSSISVTAEFHMCLPKTLLLHMPNSISGLFYFPYMPDDSSPMLCNPSTRRLLCLPHLKWNIDSFFGYDPINKQFSVLAMNGVPSVSRQDYQILNLRSGRLSWKSLNCPLLHYSSETNICINGVLYYIAYMPDPSSHSIASFNLNSEEFKFIDIPWRREHDLLVNFKGKLGGINGKWAKRNEKGFHIELSLWVLEDADKQEWSQHVYDVSPIKLWNNKDVRYCIAGMTAMGDIVFTLRYITCPLYVYFFNLEKKTLQEVEIKGFEEFKSQTFFGSVDYVEELRGLNWS